MPKSTTAANDYLALILNATPIANYADNAASSPAANLFLSLHTASPGVGGSQLTNETSYTNYVRIPVARTAGGWTVASAVGVNTALAQFAQCGATGAAITHVAIGTAVSGSGKVIWQGALNATLNVTNIIQPQFNASALSITES